MIGVFANVLAVIAGSLIGLLFKKGISSKFSDSVMIAVGLCVVYIGIRGAFDGNDTLILVISMALGAVIGTLIDFDKHINNLGSLVEKRFSKNGTSGSVSKAFVTASLLFCIGAMTVVGSINAGLGDNGMLYTKSVLDFFSSIMLTISLGWGVMLSSIFILVLQGSIALLAGVLEPLLTEAAICEATSAGSILILAIGLNMTGITKIKVANYLPAVILAPVLVLTVGSII